MPRKTAVAEWMGRDGAWFRLFDDHTVSWSKEGGGSLDMHSVKLHPVVARELERMATNVKEAWG